MWGLQGAGVTGEGRADGSLGVSLAPKLPRKERAPPSQHRLCGWGPGTWPPGLVSSSVKWVHDGLGRRSKQLVQGKCRLGCKGRCAGAAQLPFLRVALWPDSAMGFPLLCPLPPS